MLGQCRWVLRITLGFRPNPSGVQLRTYGNAATCLPGLHELHSTWTRPAAPRQYLDVCPTDPVWTITHSDKSIALEHLRWGLAPFWWKLPLKKLPATFNGRAETTKPAFREAFKRRRAVIPASGWYEWRVREDGKQPWFFTPKHEPIALIAALWESWTLSRRTTSCARRPWSSPNGLT